MKELIVRFVREEKGQDLVEYTLLLAFVWWTPSVGQKIVHS